MICQQSAPLVTTTTKTIHSTSEDTTFGAERASDSKNFSCREKEARARRQETHRQSENSILASQQLSSRLSLSPSLPGACHYPCAHLISSFSSVARNSQQRDSFPNWRLARLGERAPATALHFPLVVLESRCVLSSTTTCVNLCTIVPSSDRFSRQIPVRPLTL